MRLILANESHIFGIKCLLTRNFDEVLSKAHSPEIVKKFKEELSTENLTLQLSRKKVYVMVDDATVIGTGAFANFGTREQPKWSVSNLYVLPENHRQGIGKQLIERLIQDAQYESAKELHVPSSRNAVGFYQKMGFVIDSAQPDFADEITWMTLALG
ncbi:MAG: GNAT family N-acetyltransferase [Oscillospiraceae bacterium]|jgi:ribosomal protein S18 acetylase RimI-like enzyme|nr:GNAT family N-acetyltransferase [Oscillospiraceae bacterium]